MKRTGIILGFVGLLLLASCNEKKVDTVKVGLLHSLSGTMSISETSVRDAELLAISETQKYGGAWNSRIAIWRRSGRPRMLIRLG